MDNLIYFLKEKKIIICVIVIAIIILTIMAIKFNKKEKSNDEQKSDVDKSWKIDSVDESTNDPFADQYQQEEIVEE